jgi:hypothetical protein
MSSLYQRQVVEVGGIPYVEYGDVTELPEDSVLEPSQHNYSPVCGQCVNFNPSQFNPTSGYCCTCTLSRNEWDEVELSKPITSYDPACPRFEMDCPF